MNITNAEHFTFNTHHSLLVVGQTGSGKSELVRRLLRRFEATHSPEEFKYVIFDLKAVEFVPSAGDEGANPAYLLRDVITEPDFVALEELVALSEQRALSEKPQPKLLVYIEECDMVAVDQDRFEKAVMTLNAMAEKANMKIIYSTSRAGEQTTSEKIMRSFDLLLAGQLQSKETADYLGVEYIEQMPSYGFIVKEKVS